MSNQILKSRIKNAGDHICKWYNAIQEGKEQGHWDQLGYKQGLRDCLVILIKHKVIKDYSFTSGVILED